MDTGLATAALGLSAERLASNRPTSGSAALAHFRDRSGVDVDIVLETADGSVVGLEVKSATTADHADARGLRFLAERLGRRFALGLVLTTGPGTARLDDKIWVTPASALWGGS